jgi:hypothetical protein
MKEPRMPIFKLPLSGNVVQSINPFSAFMSGSQLGLINIDIGQSSEPNVEQDVLTDVASYGKQLGRIGDALMVLLSHIQPRNKHETDVIKALEEMLEDIAKVKERHNRPAIHPGAFAAKTPAKKG